MYILYPLSLEHCCIETQYYKSHRHRKKSSRCYYVLNFYKNKTNNYGENIGSILNYLKIVFG